MSVFENSPQRPDNAGFRRIGYAFFVSALLASAVVVSAQDRPGSLSGPLVELSEAALDAYEAGDWQRVQDYLEAGSGQAGSLAGPAGAKQDQMLGQLEKIVLFETETASDGCSVRRYAVRFEKGLGRLEMRLCLDEGLWRLRSMEVLPDPIYFSEYLLTEIAPQQTGIPMMFAFCRQDGVHEAAGEVHCLAVTAAGETLSYALNASEPGRLRITDARVAAEAPPSPTREVLEPVVRELLDRCSRQAGGEIRASATPGFRETVDLPLLDQVLDEIRRAFGPVRKARWLSWDSDPIDGLPVVRMAVQFEKTQGEAVVKLVPFQGGWAMHRFKMIAPEGSAAELVSIETSLLRLIRDLALDSSATIDCPVEGLSQPGSRATCRTQTHGRSVAVEVLRSERPFALGKNDLTLTSDDLQLALGRTLVELERPLGWEARSLTCDGALEPGATTRCLVWHDDGSTRLDVRVTSGGKTRVVAVGNVG